MATQISEGLQKVVLQQGTGQRPNRGDTITVQCTGMLHGDPPKKFWSTTDPGQKPFSFQVGLQKVIAGWDEGCMTMSLGEKARLIIAPHKGYGAGGFPAWGIPPNATLNFEIEILKIGN
ncbi:peptidyl-prolyl cis-trans isomerase FKBP12-like [Amphibalanus amphitrite]|uniref:peptidyl-prolyl cis-trans isomerase FKBP12-like n=1 Tax=Amphibalanus amphitrite TaxID=1232801 RepID=UPI001C8FF37C|nr:peptidyl-prolyl cis-trans isomerase FKBP12-like [Amphibalanus amphitrite]XP_043245682.1 peptidyl-prolyl cis-trans isomerase FKBP12-like [Amphibalanus amphitrite]